MALLFFNINKKTFTRFVKQNNISGIFLFNFWLFVNDKLICISRDSQIFRKLLNRRICDLCCLLLIEILKFV